MTSDTSKVVAFKGGPVSEGQFTPPPNVIDLLSEILEEAKAGRIAAVGLVTISPTHFIGTSFAQGEGHTAHDLVAGSVYLLDRCKKAVLDAD